MIMAGAMYQVVQKLATSVYLHYIYPPMIHVEHLHKSFGEVHAVAGVSFDVTKGEVVGLLGPNGAGKTTTMRIITGYIPADSGTIAVDGVPVATSPDSTKRLIGYLPEDTPLYPDLEVVEFLSYIARLRDLPKAQIGDRIKEMVGVCGLGGVVGRPIGELSKGYRQRVGLAQAMIHHPPILILDEPTSGLDPNQIVEIRSLIKDIGKERTVILSTHILQEVEATCSRALIISNGSLVGHGTLDELSRTARGEAIYTVTIKASKEAIEGALAQMEGLDVRQMFEQGERVKVVLQGTAETDRSEDLFNWVVGNGWCLAELKRETASLEEVFKELTR
jgi:ABC-2 type transport system ATP-binding protein